MAWSDLLERSALEQAALVARRQVSSEELTRLYLDRVQALNPQVNAFVRVWPEEALRSARKKDAQVRAGGQLPAFHGVPMGVKDLNLVRGHTTRFGSRGVAIPSPKDCNTTASLRRGGFVLLGKTATSELGAMPVTEPDTHGPTRNPWDPDRTAGGSSGGAGAAVAAGMLPIAQGSDGGGSIRIPASLNHLYGFKPSRGRVPNSYGIDDTHILYTCGPLARTVDDAAAMTDILAGLDHGRPHWLRPPPNRLAVLARDAPRGLRIGLFLDNPVTPVEPAARDAAVRAARVLESLGHHVEERAVPSVTVEEFLPVWQWLVAQAPVFLHRRLQPVTRWLREPGRRRRRDDVLELQHAISARLASMLDGLDAAVTPTIPIRTPAVGQWKGLPPEQEFHAAAAMGAFTAPANITGAPAASIPAGLMDGAWPVGVQVMARPGEDALVLALSRVLEEAMPWRGRWAPLAGRPASN